MKCTKCGCDCNKRILYRTEPKGQMANWMCLSCIEEWKPELIKNIKLLNNIKDEGKIRII